MKYLGFFIILLATLIFSREYARYMRKRLAECEGFLAFIGYMKIQVGCFLKPPRELARGFSSDVLRENGFLEALEAGDGLYQAYKKSEASLSLSAEEKRTLEVLFSSLGEGYLDDGVKLIDTCHKKLGELCLSLRAECPRSIKLVSTLSVTAAIGFLILVI